MAIFREVRTEVYCDIYGEQIVTFKDTGRTGGVSRAWAAYYARQEGCTTGKKVICKNCRISRRIEKCSLQKKYGEIRGNKRSNLHYDGKRRKGKRFKNCSFIKRNPKGGKA